jgi:glyoxylase-like metal-dependent hydrolase (beta-lactamase superfamily II)
MKITEQLHALRIPFRISLGPGRHLDRFVYVYLVMSEDITLIDSGVAGSESTIFSYIESQGRRPDEIARLILTHAHPDHMGAACTIVQATGCEVWLHPAEHAWAQDVQVQKQQRPVPGFDTLVAGSVLIDHDLADGQDIELGGDLRATVVHTPGHSPGSVSLLLEPGGVVISGDAIPQPGELPIYDDAAASVRSVQRLQAASGVHVLLSSWDSPRHGDEVARALHAGLGCLHTIDRAVHACAAGAGADAMALCQAVVAQLGLPAFAVNPLVARSFVSHLGAVTPPPAPRPEPGTRAG